MQRAIRSVQASKSARVYPTTVGLPCVPEDACTRASDETGTRSRPNGYASLNADLYVKGASASESRETPNAARNRSACNERSASRGSCSTGSNSALVRIPVLLEVPDERGAQMAVRLLAAVRGHVLAKDVERLRRHAHRPPVGGSVDESRAGQRLHARFPRGVHLPGRVDPLIAEQVALRRARLELEPRQDRLSRQPIANRARH